MVHIKWYPDTCQQPPKQSRALYGLNYGPDNSLIGIVGDGAEGIKRGLGAQIFGLPHTVTPSAKVSHTHVVIHEMPACQRVDENGISCRKPTVNLSPDDRQMLITGRIFQSRMMYCIVRRNKPVLNIYHSVKWSIPN